MRRPAARPGWLQRPDLRDKVLIIFGALDVLLGYAYGLAHVPAGVRTNLSTATEIMPLEAYAAAWAAIGLYCVAAGFVSRHVVGFVLAYSMFYIWAAIYFAGWLNGDPGRGWVSASIFAALASAVYCTSGLIDPGPLTADPKP